MGSNFNLNKVILGGRLTADPELKQTQSGVPVTTFSLAVKRKVAASGQQPETDFFYATAWRGTAEFICRYFKKGSSICITGSIHPRSWIDSNGVKKNATDIVVDEAYFVDGKGGADVADQQPTESANAPTAQNSGYMPSAYNAPKFDEIKTDSDLPF
jgi:single-strand DNA-binding protein